ncbi:hypothetical protein ACN28S_60205 [Cystobacter fuscus]
MRGKSSCVYVRRVPGASSRTRDSVTYGIHWRKVAWLRNAACTWGRPTAMLPSAQTSRPPGMSGRSRTRMDTAPVDTVSHFSSATATVATTHTRSDTPSEFHMFISPDSSRSDCPLSRPPPTVTTPETVTFVTVQGTKWA